MGLGEVVCTGEAGEGLRKGDEKGLADSPWKPLFCHEDWLRGLGTFP